MINQRNHSLKTHEITEKKRPGMIPGFSSTVICL